MTQARSCSGVIGSARFSCQTCQTQTGAFLGWQLWLGVCLFGLAGCDSLVNHVSSTSSSEVQSETNASAKPEGRSQETDTPGSTSSGSTSSGSTSSGSTGSGSTGSGGDQPSKSSGSLARRGGQTASPQQSFVKNITFDTIKFDIKPNAPYDPSMLTDQIVKLQGQRVIIRGWMLPRTLFSQSGIKEFILVRDNQECCFGPGAAIYDCIQVKMASGKTADFTVRPIAVEGVFRLEPLTDEDDFLWALYFLSDAKVR